MMKAYHKFVNGRSEEVVDMNDSNEYLGETNLGSLPSCTLKES